jgi:cardiolipin synthase
VSDRISIPNAFSFARLLGVPLFLWLVLVPEADVWAFVVLAVAGATDWIDGALARALNQRSRLGIVLDPLADRLYIAATLLGLALRSLIPWWLVGILVAREPARRADLRQGRIALPVTYVGKAATFCLLWGFPLLLLGGLPSWYGTAAVACGWAFALWGTALYWWAGIRYVQQALALRARG